MSKSVKEPLHDIAKIIPDTGMRPEEVFRMRVENLDFEQKAIFNPYGKTKAARRTIPITDDALSVLRLRVKKRRTEERHICFDHAAMSRNPSAVLRRRTVPQ